MPWTCVPCETEVADTHACPGCGSIKTSWTVVAARTRTLTIERKRFTVEVGTDPEPRPAPAGPAAVSLVEATKVRSLAKADARDLAARGLLPATAHTLFVGLLGAGAATADVTLELLFAARPSEEVVLPGPGVEGQPLKVVFVHGEGACDDLRFEGLHVVDATDVAGPAPSVEVSALGRPAQAVALTSGERVFLFSV